MDTIPPTIGGKRRSSSWQMLFCLQVMVFSSSQTGIWLRMVDFLMHHLTNLRLGRSLLWREALQARICWEWHGPKKSSTSLKLDIHHVTWWHDFVRQLSLVKRMSEQSPLLQWVRKQSYQSPFHCHTANQIYKSHIKLTHYVSQLLIFLEIVHDICIYFQQLQDCRKR